MILLKDYTCVLEFLSQINCPVSLGEPMSRYTTFGIGGKADVFVSVSSAETLKKVVSFLNDHAITFMVIGNGSNLLVADEGVRGVVLHLCGNGSSVEVDGERITCFAGEKLAAVCTAALNNSLSGLEFAWGIPASVGGAVYMNAGAYISEMSAVVESVTSITPKGETIVRNSGDFDFSYRHSRYQKSEEIIAEVTFKLTQGESAKIKAMMDDFISRRKDKQPLEFPSAGSTFKRPNGGFAAAMIDECGLKGTRVGGAEVSCKHAGFVVNVGGATSRDVKELIKIIQDKVYKENGIMLEPEVIFVD